MKRMRWMTVLAMAVVTLGLAACNEEETGLGLELQDPATMFEGVTDTAYGSAITVFDDSLLTSGQRYTLVGCYEDAQYGHSEAIYYTQIGIEGDNGVQFDANCVIDSVVLSLALADLYPAVGTKAYRDLHFEVYQLAEAPLTDTAYYADDELPITNRCFFDGVVRLVESDSMVLRLPLNDNFVQLIDNKNYDTESAFVEAVKGLRIRLLNDGTPQMVTLNLAASATGLAVHYTYNADTSSLQRIYNFELNQSVAHFTRYENLYVGPLSVFNTNQSDSLDGAQYLYLCPMGGTNVRVNFDDFVRQFHQQHPYAVIHYAELLVPVADIAPGERPDQLAAFKCYQDGAVASIPDMVDAYTNGGFDGAYDAERGLYRIRVTQHLQKMLLSGMDLGTLLVLNGRRSSVLHTVINGCDATATGGNPIRIAFVYSE